MAPVSLLTAIDSTSHIHLVIGSNPLAAARCAKSLEVGAKPRLIAPENAQLHYALQKRIDSGEVEWLKKGFEDDDLLRLGRDEINGVVDAVFVTLGARDPLSESPSELRRMKLMSKARIFLNSADEIAYQ
jgi:uroporphyrin-III C-methyltransferase